MILEPTTITCKTGKEFKLVPIGPEYAEEYLEFMHQVSSDTHFMSRYGDEVKQDEKALSTERERIKMLKESRQLQSRTVDIRIRDQYLLRIDLRRMILKI